MNKKFLIDYLNTDSPSHDEIEAQRVWVKELKTISHHQELLNDNYGNVAAIVKKELVEKYIYEEPFKVVIDAHCDEIGWVVSRITDEGFIYVKRNGGTDNDITPATRIKIMTESGRKINGFFGWIPIHLKERDKEKVKKPTEDNIFIDVAATSKEEVEEMGIELGNHIVVNREAEIINDKYVVGKSLDDKIGGFILIEVLRMLKEEKIKLPYDLYVVNSVQEETGLRGAHMITETIKPDVAICIDPCFDTNTPMIDKDKYGDFKLGDGVIFRKGSDVHINMFRLMKQVAKDNDIKHKVSIGGGGGTNTNSYNLSNGGVISSTLSIPLRYMHTPNEMVLLTDIEEAIEYMVQLLLNIEYKHDFKDSIE